MTNYLYVRISRMNHNSSVGDAAYDPFSGSGTTIIAAQTTGRICYAMEIDPRHVNVAVKRWQDFTGEKAQLESGEFFNDIARERELDGRERDTSG